MMRSHVCQCDEPDYLNAETFKNLISDAQFTYRRFIDQTTRPLNNRAKLILTSNDSIVAKGDAGVITRLKYCLRITHKFKPLYPAKFDTTKNFYKFIRFIQRSVSVRQQMFSSRRGLQKIWN